MSKEAREFLVSRGYVDKDEFTTFDRYDFPIDTDISEIMEAYYKYRVSQSTPFARQPAYSCQNCERYFTTLDEIVLRDAAEGIPLSVTICGNCGTKTPFIHQ